MCDTNDKAKHNSTPESGVRFRLLREAISRNRIVLGVIALSLLGHAVLAAQTAGQLSVTHDEYWHLPVGLLTWQTGRFDHDRLNPPLGRAWAALPLIFVSDQIVFDEPSPDAVEIGDRFLKSSGVKYRQMFFLGRCMIVAVSVFTGAMLAAWAWSWFGAAAGGLAAILWSASPTILANASLVTTDLPAACFFVATSVLLWRFATYPGWKRAAQFGLVLGLAQLVKFTSLLLIPLCLLLWFVYRVRNPSLPRASATSSLLQWSLAAAVALGVWNAGYLFRGSCSTWRSYDFQSHTLTQLSDGGGLLNSVPIPLPRDYMIGLDRQRAIMEAAHPVFLDGRWSTEGFAEYYLKALWYKVPHAAQMLMLLSAVWLMWPAGRPREWRKQLGLIIPIILLVSIASFSRMQLGIRYILPAFGFLILLAAQSARWWDVGRFRLRGIAVAVCALWVLTSPRFHPHHLAYFNALAGGPVGGRVHLLDSNIDWGQDLWLLADFVRQEQIDEIGLAYFGTLPPAEFGIPYYVPPRIPQKPGWYAVSVNYLGGRPHVLRHPDGSSRLAGLGEFSYFRRFRPVARIGYSIELFHIRAEDLPRRSVVPFDFVR